MPITFEAHWIGVPILCIDAIDTRHGEANADLATVRRLNKL